MGSKARFYSMLKIALKYEKLCVTIFFTKYLLIYYSMTLLAGLPESSGKRTRSFPLSISFHHGSPCLSITWGTNNEHVGARSLETKSFPIKLIVIIIIKYSWATSHIKWLKGE
jgi:hypothetical protein